MISFLDRLFGRKKKPDNNIEEESGNITVQTTPSGNTEIQEEKPKRQDEYEVKPKAVDGKLPINGDTPAVVGELEVCGGKYLVSHFEMDFMQDVDKKNHPDSEVYGGFITVTLIDKPDDAIDEWAVSSNKQHDGCMKFYKNEVKSVDNSLICITFAHAFCTQYAKNVNLQENESLTTLRLCPKTINIGQEVFETKRKI